MIGKLKGSLTEVYGNEGIIETQSGVGYVAFLPPIYFNKPLPYSVELYIYTHVREDALVLYGFLTRHHMNLFHMVHSVSGVGPKTAYSIVNYTQPDEIRHAVKTNDVGFFTSIPGLGKKTAMKIILELSSKLKEDVELSALHLNEDDESVMQALASLGFDSKDARSVVRKIETALPIEERIKEGIRLLSKKK